MISHRDRWVATVRFIEELRRRRVFRISAIYIVAAWVVLQVADLAFESWGLPAENLRFVWIAAILIFPLAVLFAWRYDITDEGVVRTPDRADGDAVPLALERADFIVLFALAVVGMFVAYSTTNRILWVPELPELSIVVLPFESISTAAEDEHLADGLTEELIHALARIPALKVTGRTSSFEFKDRNENLGSIGSALGVANALEGSIRRSGNQLRVTAQLVGTADGFQRWSETYDRSMSDVLAIQDDIARKVVDALRIEMLGEHEPAESSREVDPQAYALYLRAVALSPYGGAPFKLAEAQALIEQVVELDPGFAPAWNRLAVIHGRRLFLRDPEYPNSPAKAMVTIMGAIETARELDPNDAEVYASLAGLAWIFEEDAAKAAPLVERALKLDPSDLDIIRFALDFATFLGRPAVALEMSERLVDRDPLCVACRLQLARLYGMTQRWEEAETQFRTLQATGQNGLHWSLGIVLLHLGRADEALTSFEKHQAFEHLRLQGKAMAWHDLDMQEDSAAALNTLAEVWGKERPIEVAQAYAYVGRNDEAFEILNGMLPDGLSILQTEFLRPLFHKLRSDARWDELLLRIGRAPEQVDQIPFSLP